MSLRVLQCLLEPGGIHTQWQTHSDRPTHTSIPIYLIVNNPNENETDNIYDHYCKLYYYFLLHFPPTWWLCVFMCDYVALKCLLDLGGTACACVCSLYDTHHLSLLLLVLLLLVNQWVITSKNFNVGVATCPGTTTWSTATAMTSATLQRALFLRSRKSCLLRYWDSHWTLYKSGDAHKA